MPLETELLVASVSNVPQWSSSGLPVCSNYVNYHWIATGTPLGTSINQCSSSGIPGAQVVFQSVPYIQTNSGLPLDDHCVIVSTSTAAV